MNARKIKGKSINIQETQVAPDLHMTFNNHVQKRTYTILNK